jgi:hypothetical protein
MDEIDIGLLKRQLALVNDGCQHRFVIVMGFTFFTATTYLAVNDKGM